MTEGLLDGVREAAADELQAAVDLRRRIHLQPELGLENPRTAEAILDALDGLPLTIHEGTTTTSVLAVLDGDEPGPTVLLRGDMDALPMPEDTGLDFASTVDGAMHACGHDAHVAMLTGAARVLAVRRGSLRGRVAFMFQPGEEGHGGAKVMLDEGVLDVAASGAEPVSMAFAIHITPMAPSGLVLCRAGAILASSDELRIVVRGRGGHASMPHQAADPIPAACEIVLGLQSMVTRRVDAFDPAVVTIAKLRAGTTSNVIPESAELRGTIRTVSERTRASVLEHVRRVAEGIASAHGLEAEVELHDGYPVTVNTVEASRFALDSVTAVLGEGHALELPTPGMGAEDWSYVLQEVPGCMAILGAQPPGPGPAAPNHSNRMVLDEAAMATGIATHASVALRWLDGARAL